MKKAIGVLSILILSYSGLAQSHSAGTLSFQADYSFGLHLSVYESKFNDVLIDEDSSGVATSMFDFSIQYSIFDFLSAGAYFGIGSYIEDPDNTEAQGNSILSFGADVRANLVNKFQFNWYLGGRLGYSALEINRKTLNGFVDLRANYSSPQTGLFSGINYYFNDYIGLNVELGYANHNFLMNEYHINDNSQDLSNFENRLDVKGIILKLGLSFKFD